MVSCLKGEIQRGGRAVKGKGGQFGLVRDVV